eukprot:scaffold41953_cov53-Attheya_sp.AAC.3
MISRAGRNLNKLAGGTRRLAGSSSLASSLWSASTVSSPASSVVVTRSSLDKSKDQRHVTCSSSCQWKKALSTERQYDTTTDSLLNKSTPKSSRALVEAWMVNLNRGDDKWLSSSRTPDWFTGVPPTSCPGVDTNGKIRSLSLPNLNAVTRQSAKEYFDNSWTLFETLFAENRKIDSCELTDSFILKYSFVSLSPPVHGIRHPQIFYYGHTPCLYINKLRVAGVLNKPVNAYFESIFELGVDEMLWDDMHKNDMLWPTVFDVHNYRKDVYETVVNAILTHPSLDDCNGTKPVKVDQDHPMWALFLGFEHERIHLETSSVLFRETPIHLVQTPPNWPFMHPSAEKDSVSTKPLEGVHYPSNRMISVSSSAVDLGKPPSFPSFGWDNEYGHRTVNVPSFHASEHMVTNGEFWEFVSDGGYRDQQYWCEDSWNWRTHRNMKWPFFWQPDGPAGSHEFSLRTIFEVVPMKWDWPVDINYYEAKAFCRWKTNQSVPSPFDMGIITISPHDIQTEKYGSPTSQPLRVLTEAEHHVIRHKHTNLDSARSSVEADKVMVTGGLDFASGPTGANLNMAFSSQNPVNYFAPSHTGHRDTTGNVWEWTEDHFNPLKGFEVHHVYDDFSTPCFDGKHHMIVGGSFISTGDEASVFARFHFRPHFLQHSGFRLVASEDAPPCTTLEQPVYFPGATGPSSTDDDSSGNNTSDPVNVYETDDLLHMYLGLHYPTSGEAEGVDLMLMHKNAPLHGLRFPQRVAQLLTSLNPERTNNRALDIGCAVGGASFELAKTFDQVDAFDFR